MSACRGRWRSIWLVMIVSRRSLRLGGDQEWGVASTNLRHRAGLFVAETRRVFQSIQRRLVASIPTRCRSTPARGIFVMGCWAGNFPSAHAAVEATIERMRLICCEKFFGLVSEKPQFQGAGMKWIWYSDGSWLRFVDILTARFLFRTSL